MKISFHLNEVRRAIGLTCFFLLSINLLSSQNSIYVSLNGDDSNSGSCDKPVATLQQAVNQSRSTGINSILIYGGRYHFDQSVNLNAQDAGLEIKGFEDDNVIFDGGLRINEENFSKVTSNLGGRIKNSVVNNLYSSKIYDPNLISILSRGNAKLSFNDRAINIARYPNIGTAVFEENDAIGSIETKNTQGTHANPVGFAFTMVNEFPINNAAWEDEIQKFQKVEIVGYLSSGWLREYNLLATTQYNGNMLRTVNGTRYGVNTIHNRAILYFSNIFYELDSPGEWFFDEVDEILYIYPPGKLNDKSIITAYAGPEFLNISNTNNIKVENLTIQNLFTYGDFSQGAIDVRNSDNIHVAGITFKNMDMLFINFWHDVTNSGAKSCDIIDAGSSRLYGGSFSNSHVTHGNNYIENCHYTKVYAKDEYGKFCGINGAGQIFRNNLCHNTNGQPLTFQGIDHTLEKNEFFNTAVEEGDGGSFYTGNQMWNNGTIVKHNFIHHSLSVIGNVVPKAGVHLDDATCGVDVIENIFYRTGQGVNGTGGGNRVNGNIAIKNWIGLRNLYRNHGHPVLIDFYNDYMNIIQNNPMSTAKENYFGRALRVAGINNWQVGLDSTNWNTRFSPFWLNRYPRFGPMMDAFFNGKQMSPYLTELKNNFYFDNENLDLYTVSPPVVDVNNNDQINLSIFSNPGALDFSYNGSQPNDAPNIPFDQIGLYPDKYRCALPVKNVYREAVNSYFANRKVHGEPLNFSTRTALTYFNTGLVAFGTVPCSDVIVVDSINTEYYFDAGTPSSPIWTSNNAIQLTSQTNELNYGWVNPDDVFAVDRGTNAGNNINRDLVYSAQPNVFEANVENGNWQVLITFGDIVAHDNIQVKAEDFIVLPDVDIQPNNYVNEVFVIHVKDGKLTIEFSDQGGTDPNWAVTRLVLTKTSLDAPCELNCLGVTIDDDGDGVCNTNDSCPNLDQSLIGTSCDDNNECTFNDVYTEDCICLGTLNGFQSLQGQARDIGHGGGHTFMVSNNNYIYKYNNCGQSWELFSSSPTADRIDVDDMGYPWIISTDNRIYKWDGSSFVLLPGLGIDIGVNKLHVGIIRTDKRVAKWNGSTWDLLNFNYPNMKRIDMTSDGLARLVSEDNIHYWDQGSGVYPKGSFICEDISIKEGSIGPSYVLSDAGDVFRYEGGGNYGLLADNASGINLAVSKEEDFWVTQTTFDIRLLENCQVKKRFETIVGQAKDIGTGGGKTFIVGSNSAVYQYNACDNAWDLFSSAPLANRIDVDGNGNPWIIANNNTIHNWNGSSFTQLPGAGIDIGVNNSQVGIIGTNNKIYKWNGSNWNQLNLSYPNMVRIDMTSNGASRTVSIDGIFYWDQGSGVYPKGNFKTKDVSVPQGTDEGYVLSEDGSVYSYIGAGNYSLIGGADGANFTMSADNEIWINQTDLLISYHGDCSVQTCPYLEPNICLWLEGAFDTQTGKMQSALLQRGLLPAGQPYNLSPWNYTGSEGTGWSIANYPAGSIDWVLVSLRTNPSPNSEVAVAAAILLEDGCLHFPNDKAFSQSIGTSFYIVVEHKSHLAIMSPNPVQINGGTLSYDFRTSDSYVAGTGYGQKPLANQVWVMFAGDGEQINDGTGYDINANDNATWILDNGVFDVYLSTDFNLDGEVSGADRLLWVLNNGVFSTVAR